MRAQGPTSFVRPLLPGFSSDLEHALLSLGAFAADLEAL